MTRRELEALAGELAQRLGAAELALRRAVEALEASWLEDMDRTGDYSAPPPPALDRARQVLETLGVKVS